MGQSKVRQLYANLSNLSIYSSHVHKLVEHCALSVFSVSGSALRSRDRRASVAQPRQIAMYLAHVTFGLSLTQIGQLFSRDRTTVAHACRAVEDLRDDPVMDKALGVLETALVRLGATN
ncbi:MAG: DNA replication initiation protein [Rhodomicrobium sp.]|nr:DNA replication initiation protein [Rhodomicrobium sp.]